MSNGRPRPSTSIRRLSLADPGDEPPVPASAVPADGRLNKNAMKHRGFTGETIALRKEIVALARKARVHRTDADASCLGHRMAPRFARRCRLCVECRFSPKTSDEVSLLPAITAVSYELVGHSRGGKRHIHTLSARGAGNYSHWRQAWSRLSPTGGAGNGALP
jgi:hypothetical protein